MQISVIMTVLNEGASIRAVLDSLVAQTRRPDEVVIVDGGSRDQTVAELQQYAEQLPLQILTVPGANIAQGRNAAIRAATGDIIAVTDAGVRCDPTWLENLTAPFAQPTPPAVVAGFFESDPRTVLEVAMGATVLPTLADINPRTFLPSSRSVAFTKTAWAAVGGYPAWLDFSEDVVFDLALREKTGAFGFAPQARVYFRPRGSLRALAKQYYQYARGDGKAGLFPRQHAIRYFAYWVVAPLLGYAALTITPGLWLVGVLAGLAYLRRPLQRLEPRLAPLAWPARLQALVYLPLIRLIGDVAKMVGYPVGVVWRWRNPQNVQNS